MTKLYIVLLLYGNFQCAWQLYEVISSKYRMLSAGQWCKRVSTMTGLIFCFPNNFDLNFFSLLFV